MPFPPFNPQITLHGIVMFGLVWHQAGAGNDMVWSNLITISIYTISPFSPQITPHSKKFNLYHMNTQDYFIHVDKA